MPAKDGVGCDDGSQFLHGFTAQDFSFDGQNAALGVIEEETLTSHLIHQDFNLGVLEVDNLLLLTVHPANQDQKEDMPGLKDEIHPWSVANRSLGGQRFPVDWKTGWSKGRLRTRSDWTEKPVFLLVFLVGWVF